MRVALIINPQAGRRCGAAVGALAARGLVSAGWSVETMVTEAAGHAQALARSRVGRVDLIVGVGGDGTLSELLNGLSGTGLPCGLVPCGTGNDFARCAGIQADPERAVRQLLDGAPRPVDMGRLVSASRRFINTVGVGFDARVAARINRRRRVTGGFSAYLPAIVAELTANPPLVATVEADGERIEGRWLLVAVANGQSYGAGLRIAPRARPDDGLLDIVTVQHTSRADVLRSLRMVMRGEADRHAKVRMRRTRHVRIETETPTPALVDGDVLAATPLEIEVEPGAALLWR